MKTLEHIRKFMRIAEHEGLKQAIIYDIEITQTKTLRDRRFIDTTYSCLFEEPRLVKNNNYC
ncbi:MAG: hypothetical protein WC781_00860 [Candidatus Pacearchaeota archaeon]|jgi:hypothetical protein